MFKKDGIDGHLYGLLFTKTENLLGNWYLFVILLI